MGVNFKKPIEIRDLRNGSWVWVHTHILRDKRLSKSDKLVYLAIASFTNNSQEAYPSVEKLAEIAVSTSRQVYISIKSLESMSYIGIERRHGKPNLYSLLKTFPNNTPEINSPLKNKGYGGEKKGVGGGEKKGVRTISSITIPNNYVIADKQQSPFKRLEKEKQQPIHRIVYHLEDTLHTSIVNWGKQAKALKMMFKAGYTEEQIKKVITFMATQDDFFDGKGFDLTTVSNQIPRYKAQSQKHGI